MVLIMDINDPSQRREMHSLQRLAPRLVTRTSRLWRAGFQACIDLEAQPHSSSRGALEPVIVYPTTNDTITTFLQLASVQPHTLQYQERAWLVATRAIIKEFLRYYEAAFHNSYLSDPAPSEDSDDDFYDDSSDCDSDDDHHGDTNPNLDHSSRSVSHSVVTHPPGHQRIISSLLAGQVRPATARVQSEAGMPVFQWFLKDVYKWSDSQINSTAVWFDDPVAVPDADLQKILLLYAVHLSRTAAYKSKIGICFQALANEASNAGYTRLQQFTIRKPIIHARNKLLGRGVSPRQKSRQRMQNRTFPVTGQMVQQIITRWHETLHLLLGSDQVSHLDYQHWVRPMTTAHFNAIDEAFAWAAGLVQLQLAVRASNLLKSESDSIGTQSIQDNHPPDDDLPSLHLPPPAGVSSPATPRVATGDSDSDDEVVDVHPIMCKDVFFEVNYTSHRDFVTKGSFTSVRVTKWVSARGLRISEEGWNHIRTINYDEIQVSAVHLRFHTSKSNQRGAKPIERTVLCNSYGSVIFGRVLLSIAMHAKYDDGTDMFFSRRCVSRYRDPRKQCTPSRKRIRVDTLRKAVKHLATANGFNPINFGTKSFKSAAISLLQDMRGGSVPVLHQG
jgi:hypothetical protein